MRGRGQSFSGEFLVGFVMFMGCLILLLAMWNNSTKDVLITERKMIMSEQGVNAIEKLVRTPGTPDNWGVGNVTSLGLVNNSRILMPEKVKAFVRLMSDTDNDLCKPGIPNYECNAYLLGMGGFQFRFNMTYMNGTVAIVNGTRAETGRWWDNYTDSLALTRTAILGDEIVRIRFIIWR